MIKYSVENGVAYIGIDSPYNALDLKTLRQFTGRLDELFFRRDLRVVVIQGERGRFFCTGAHPPEIKKFKSEKELADFCRLFPEMLKKIMTLPQLTIALVCGKSAGSGVSIACACDKNIGLAGCSFKMSETSLGFDPMIVIDPLIKKMGAAKTHNMILNPLFFFDADWALENGLLDCICDTEDELNRELKKMTGEATNYNPTGVAEWKKVNPFFLESFPIEDRIRKTANMMATH